MNTIFFPSFQCLAVIFLFLAKILNVACENQTKFSLSTLNKDLHSMTIKLFSLLQFKEKISQASPTIPIRLLTTMSENVNKVAENEIKTFENVSNITKVHKNSTFDLNNMTEVIDQLINISNAENYTSVNNVPESDIFGQNMNSSESLEFIKDFLRKIKTLKVENILGPYKKSKETGLMKTVSKLLKKRKNYNLKKWEPLNSNEEVNPIDTRRLYRGVASSIADYPFMASVHVNGVFVCGGSIISKSLVITAAACLQIARNNDSFTNRSSLFVRVASDYTNKHGELLAITHVHFHPEFDPVHLRNNIAIAKVDRLKKIKNKKIRRIRLERRRKWSAIKNIELKVLGWGDKEVESNNQGETLSLTRLPVYDWQECQNRYTKYFVTQKNYCGGFTKKGGGACNRDIGGPVIINGSLAGVVSFGPPICGAPDAPTVFSDVTQQLTWIDSVLRKDGTTDAAQISLHEGRLTRRREKLRLHDLYLTIRPPKVINSNEMKFTSHASELPFPENIRQLEREFNAAAGAIVSSDLSTENSNSDEIVNYLLTPKFTNRATNIYKKISRDEKTVVTTEKNIEYLSNLRTAATDSPRKYFGNSQENLDLLYNALRIMAKSTKNESEGNFEKFSKSQELNDLKTTKHPDRMVFSESQEFNNLKTTKQQSIKKQTKNQLSKDHMKMTTTTMTTTTPCNAVRWVTNKKVLRILKKNVHSVSIMNEIIKTIYGDDYDVEYVADRDDLDNINNVTSNPKHNSISCETENEANNIDEKRKVVHKQKKGKHEPPHMETTPSKTNDVGDISLALENESYNIDEKSKIVHKQEKGKHKPPHMETNPGKTEDSGNYYESSGEKEVNESDETGDITVTKPPHSKDLENQIHHSNTIDHTPKNSSADLIVIDASQTEKGIADFFNAPSSKETLKPTINNENVINSGLQKLSTVEDSSGGDASINFETEEGMSIEIPKDFENKSCNDNKNEKRHQNLNNNLNNNLLLNLQLQLLAPQSNLLRNADLLKSLGILV